MNRNLMLHLGPARTGTTWLWDTIIDNQLYNKTVKVNHSQDWLDFIYKIRNTTPSNDQEKYLLDAWLFTLNIVTKEDTPMYLAGQRSLLSDTGMRGGVLDKERYIELEQLYRNKLSTQTQLGTWSKIEQWINKLPPVESNMVQSFARLAPLLSAFHYVLPHTTSHLSEEKIQSRNSSIFHALKSPTPEVDGDWEQRELWELRLMPSWRGVLRDLGVTFDFSNDDSVETIATGSAYLCNTKFNVDKQNGQASIDDYLENWLPAEQQQLLDQAHCLSSQYDKVKLVIGMRDPAARYASQLGLDSRVFHTHIINDIKQKKITKTKDLEKLLRDLEYAEHNDIRITSLMNVHRNKISNALRDEIRYYYLWCMSHASYCHFDRLLDEGALPSNCELVIYDVDRLHDKQYVKSIFSEIMPDDMDSLINFGKKSLASADWPLLPHQQPPPNRKLLAAATQSYHNIRKYAQ